MPLVLLLGVVCVPLVLLLGVVCVPLVLLLGVVCVPLVLLLGVGGWQISLRAGRAALLRMWEVTLLPRVLIKSWRCALWW